LFANFNSTIKADTLIVIKDQDDKVITAFKTSRSIKNLLYSSKDLNYTSYKIYTGGTIDGEETNGLYTKINSYTNGEEVSYNDSSNNMKQQESTKKKTISDTLLKVLLIELGLLVIYIVAFVVSNIIDKKKLG
jgi:hypothetical protein